MDILKSALGKYAIVRTRNEGLNSGVILEAGADGCVIGEARRLWYSKPLDPGMAWYEGVALSGLHASSKVSPPVAKKYIVEDYSITLCSIIGEKSLREAPSHES